jgi:Fanconi anemia group M protein
MAIDTRWYEIGNPSEIINFEGIEFRAYQFNIIKKILNGKNTLVVLPTGLGKTFIAICAIASAVVNGKKALILAPTKPLSEQHFSNLNKFFEMKDEILLLTGQVNLNKRIEIEKNARIIAATPQTIVNDLKKGNISIGDFGVVIFDECHRAVGRYAYTYIANECNDYNVQMIGLTASPGSKREKINQLIETLHINQIEVRAPTDSDVIKYVMPKFMRVIEVSKSKRIEQIGELLKPLIIENLNNLHKMGLLLFKNFETIPKGVLIKTGDEIQKIKISNYKFAAITSYVKLLNLIHAYDLLETQGLYAFSSYVTALMNKQNKSRALESLLKNLSFIESLKIANEAISKGEEHPKVFELLQILHDNPGKKTIVFVQYKSTIKMLVDVLSANKITAREFVGKKNGVTQMQQKQIINDFRNDNFQVLIASSIGEEGLDIPNVDLVVFYEPIPSEIRNIQRRGRTGRFHEGNIILMFTKNTKDEIYFMISIKREKQMIAVLNSIKSKLDERRIENKKGQQQLQM